jgi:hypothetical protein
MNLRATVDDNVVGALCENYAEAYMLGCRDTRHAAAELALKADACIEALRAMMVGNEYRSIGGDSPTWHIKSMPSNEDLSRAREALADFDMAKEPKT